MVVDEINAVEVRTSPRTAPATDCDDTTQDDALSKESSAGLRSTHATYGPHSDLDKAAHGAYVNGSNGHELPSVVAAPKCSATADNTSMRTTADDIRGISNSRCDNAQRDICNDISVDHSADSKGTSGGAKGEAKRHTSSVAKAISTMLSPLNGVVNNIRVNDQLYSASAGGDARTLSGDCLLDLEKDGRRAGSSHGGRDMYGEYDGEYSQLRGDFSNHSLVSSAGDLAGHSSKLASGNTTRECSATEWAGGTNGSYSAATTTTTATTSTPADTPAATARGRRANRVAPSNEPRALIGSGTASVYSNADIDNYNKSKQEYVTISDGRSDGAHQVDVGCNNVHQPSDMRTVKLFTCTTAESSRSGSNEQLVSSKEVTTLLSDISSNGLLLAHYNTTTCPIHGEDRCHYAYEDEAVCTCCSSCYGARCCNCTMQDRTGSNNATDEIAAHHNKAYYELISLSTAGKEVLKSGIPTVVSYSMSILMGTASMFAVGRSGSAVEQAGYSLGLSLGNIMLLTIGFGMATGLDTLCPQALGQRRKDLCWHYFFLSLIVVSFTYVPLAILAYHANTLLIAIKQDPEVAMYAQDLLRFLVPGLYFSYVSECVQKFCIYSKHARVPMMASSLQLACHLTLLSVMVGIFGVQPHKAAGSAVSISNFCGCAALCVFVFSKRHEMGWQEYSNRKRANSYCEGFQALCRDIGLYLKVAIPSACMLLVEWVGFEFQILTSSYFGATELAAYSISDYFNSLTYMVVMGVSVSLSSCVGNAIGTESVYGATVYYKFGIYFALAVFSFWAVVLRYVGTAIALFYSKNMDVQRTVAWNLTFIPLIILPDCMQCMMGGVIKGLGLQSRASWGSLIGMIVIMQGTGVCFGYGLGWAGRGLIVGASLGLTFVVVFQFAVLMTSNWHDCIANAKRRRDEFSENDLPGSDAHATGTHNETDGDYHSCYPVVPLHELHHSTTTVPPQLDVDPLIQKNTVV